jgi:hypothetical protein
VFVLFDELVIPLTKSPVHGREKYPIPFV